jgi:hypothetical protein
MNQYVSSGKFRKLGNIPECKLIDWLIIALRQASSISVIFRTGTRPTIYIIQRGPSLSWLYSSWMYDHLCN